MTESSMTDPHYKSVTEGICVAVEPHYLEDQSDPEEGQWVWAYRVEITNESDITVQLQARHWTITDASGKVETVDGPGVVGEQPILNPGDVFQYTSGCPLPTPSGFMVGHYKMVCSDGTPFLVDIPAFSLDLPDARASIN